MNRKYSKRKEEKKRVEKNSCHENIHRKIRERKLNYEENEAPIFSLPLSKKIFDHCFLFSLIFFLTFSCDIEINK